MHFVDRTFYTKAPLAKLAKIHAEEQPKWLAYKLWLNSGKPTPKQKAPSGKWKNAAAKELAELFLKNCGYCGISCGNRSSGELDHHLPKEEDLNADHIYDWYNFIWACHPCNNRKNNRYPLLDPCSKTDMDEIYFDYTTGEYLCYLRAVPQIREKYDNTVLWTFMNDRDEKHPENRLFLFQKLSEELENINRRSTQMAQYINVLSIRLVYQSIIDKSIAEIKKLVNCGRYLLLIKSIIETKAILNPSTGQPYSFNDFL